MNFKEKSMIRVAIEGTIAEGTGLGYHPTLSPYTNGTYTLVHLESGTSIYNDRLPFDLKVVQLWLKKVALLLDWTQPMSELALTVRDRQSLIDSIGKALGAARKSFADENDVEIVGEECEDCEKWVTQKYSPRCRACGESFAQVEEAAEEVVSA